MILPLNHKSVAMDMTFRGFCQNAVAIQMFFIDLGLLSILPQSNVGLSGGEIASTYWILFYIDTVG